MNLRQTIAKQQGVWIKKCDGKPHDELECHFCAYVGREMWENNSRCPDCPVIKVLVPEWERGDTIGCHALPSFVQWREAPTGRASAAAARLVLDDVNRIARHYHYPVREA